MVLHHHTNTIQTGQANPKIEAEPDFADLNL